MRVVSLCSGVGLLDLGLEWAGFRTVQVCEIDPWCRGILAHYAAVTTRITADGNRGIRITVSDADDNPLSDVRIQPEAAVILATEVLSTCLTQLLHDGGAW